MIRASGILISCLALALSLSSCKNKSKSGKQNSESSNSKEASLQLQGGNSDLPSILDNSKHDVPEAVPKSMLGAPVDDLLKLVNVLRVGKDDDICKAAKGCTRYTGQTGTNVVVTSWNVYVKDNRVVFYGQWLSWFRDFSYINAKSAETVGEVVGKSSRKPDYIINGKQYSSGKFEGLVQWAGWLYRDGCVKMQGYADRFRVGQPIPFFSDYRVMNTLVVLTDRSDFPELKKSCEGGVQSQLYQNRFDPSDKQEEWHGD